MLSADAQERERVATESPAMPFALHRNKVFMDFLDTAADAVVIADAAGTIVQANTQTVKLFGYTQSELIGRPVEILIPERYRSAHVTRRTAYCAAPTPRSMGEVRDAHGLDKNGREIPVDIALNPLPNTEDVLILTVIRDMTAQRRLEAELRQRTRELEEADRLKDSFLSAIAHELRSPLSVLVNVTEILRSPQGPGLRQWAAETLERQTTHMVRLTEDLLDLSRVRRGAVTLHRETVDMRAIARAAVELSGQVFEARKQHLTIEQPLEPVLVDGDSGRLAQVMSNLLTNAAKYTPESGQVWLTVARDDTTAIVRVRDNGNGISADMQSRIFDLFTQVSPGEGAASGGLGIGLSLVRSLVTMHNGIVEVFSDGPGMGSEFVVRLPLAGRPA